MGRLTLTLKKTFIIGVDDISYFPMYGLENGRYSGFAREVLDAFALEYGYTFT